MVYVHALDEGLKRALQHLMRIFSACRKRNASRGRWSWNFGILSVLELCQQDGDITGTAVFTKKEPLSVAYGIGIEEHDKEGRVITLEYENFYLVTVYTPKFPEWTAQTGIPYALGRRFWHTCWNCRKVSLWSAAGISMWHIRRSTWRILRPTGKMPDYRWRESMLW